MTNICGRTKIREKKIHQKELQLNLRALPFNPSTFGYDKGMMSRRKMKKKLI